MTYKYLLKMSYRNYGSVAMCIVNNSMLISDKRFSPSLGYYNQIKVEEMGRECSRNRRLGNSYSILFGKPEKKSPHRI